MSVCIASMANRGKEIVVATDQMVSTDAVSLDHAVVKGDFIGTEWFAMWAADDMTSVPAVLARTKKVLDYQGRPSDQWPANDVAIALLTAYQDETLARAVSLYLSPLGLSLKEFQKRGRDILQGEYATKLYELQSHRLKIEFLVAGFHKLNGSIFTVGEDDRPLISFYEKPGFWAIGSGKSMAFGAMALRRHNTLKTTQQTIYTVLEAKIAAEMSRGVGRYTTLGVMGSNDLVRTIPQDRLDSLRAIVETQGRPPIPNEGLVSIEEWWGPHRRARDASRVADLKQAVTSLSRVKQPTPRSPRRGRKSQTP